MTDDFLPLKEADDAVDNYFKALNKIYDIQIRTACIKAKDNVTTARLLKVEKDLIKLSNKVNSSPSFGLFLLDLALAFIPVVGGHYLETVLKSGIFRELNIGQRKWDLFKMDLINKIADSKKRIDKGDLMKIIIDPNTGLQLLEESRKEYAKLFKWANAKGPKLIQTEEDLTEALKAAYKGDLSNPLFEFSTPAINDHFQLSGGKLYDLLKDDSLSIFANKPQQISFTQLNEVILSRNKNNPGGLIEDLVNQACDRQININEKCQASAKFCNKVIKPLEYLYETKEAYSEMLKRLPKETDLTIFMYAMSEMFEAAVWIMFLGDPYNWFSAKDPTGQYHFIPQTGGLGLGGYTPGYFKLQVNLDQDIVDHFLDTFHPNLFGNDTRTFRQYYKEMKTKNVPKGPYSVGVDEPKGFPAFRVPNSPDLPVEHLSSTSYTADETALANLQIHFSKMYRGMKNSENYFTKIINNHSF